MEVSGFMPAPPSGPARPASRFALPYAVFYGGLFGLVSAAALEFLYIFVGSNVHVVAPGYVYRCARLDGLELKRVARKYGIRTVLNLTGCCDPLPPYLDESRATADLNICQEDVGFSACRLPPVPAVRELVDVLDRCDYPILVHCHRGIDRTGMAAAVALLLHTDASLSEAREQLGLRYGHWPLGKTAQMDRFFDLYQEWLAGRPHSRENFRAWATTDYCPGECRARIELLDPSAGPAPAAAGRPFGFRVRCTNTSVQPWVLQPGANAGVHLGWYLFSEERTEEAGEGRSGLFDAVVPPQGHVDLTVALPALPPGRYHVDLDMVNEQHAWFYQLGTTEPVTVDVEVR